MPQTYLSTYCSFEFILTDSEPFSLTILLPLALLKTFFSSDLFFSSEHTKVWTMKPGPSRTQESPEQYGLDDRSVEELKEKAIAAKGRAYCRCCLFTLSAFVPHSLGFIFNDTRLVPDNMPFMLGSCDLGPLRRLHFLLSSSIDKCTNGISQNRCSFCWTFESFN